MASVTADKITPLHIAGLGLPLIDFITPTQAEFDAGAALIAAAPTGANTPEAVREAKAQGAAHIAAAKQALTEFMDFFVTSGLSEGNNKKTLTREQADHVAGLFETMLVAARDINKVAMFLGREEEQLHIRHMGGSMTNKFHTIQSAMGDAVQTHMLGAVGAEDASGDRARVFKELAASGIDFEQLHERRGPDHVLTLDRALASFIVPWKGDRVALKAPLPEQMTGRFNKAIEQIAGLGEKDHVETYFIEGSDVSDKKFGHDAFFAFTDSAVASGKPIVFATPTDTSLILGHSPKVERARGQMFGIMRHAETGIIACNDAEAVAMFSNEKLDEERIDPATGKPYTMQAHPQVQDALTKVQHLLQEKLAGGHIPPVEPVAFVSVGKEGAYAVTASHIYFSPSIPVEKIANTIGAGDAFFSGCFVAHQKKLQRPESLPELDGIRRFSQRDLQDMLTTGQQIAHDVVEYKGAQLPPAHIARLVHGDVPTHGQLQQVDLPPAPQKEMGV